MKEYLKLLRFLKPYTYIFLLASFFMGLSAIFDGVSLGMIVPLADKVLTDKKIVIPAKLPEFLDNLVSNINTMAPFELLRIMAIVVLVVMFLKGVVTFFQGYIMSDIGQRVMRDIRFHLYRKFLNLSLDFFARKKGGELISRITNDVRLVENAVSYGLTDLIYQSFQVVLFTVVIFFIHWKLALIVFFVLPLLFFPIMKVGKKLRKLSKASQEKMADINSSISETIFGIRIIKGFSMESYEKTKFALVNSQYYKLMMKSIKRTLLLSPATEFIGAMAGIFVFYYGGREVIEGRMSFGIFGLFLGSLLSLVRPFKKLSSVNSLIQQALAANTRIYDILDEKISVDDESQVELETLKGDIVFEDVYFRYEETDVLKGINLSVEKNQIVAIVGPSGAGKSTLLDLIPRFYDPYKGRVIIDGKDIRKVSLKSLRRQIALVTQETILFNDTVKANIGYGSLSSGLDLIQEAAKKANAHDFISRLPDGYDTIIGDRGFKLSGGEKQRIAIARAILKNPAILILDEATSQLDAESEKLVQEAIDNLIQSRTVFVVAHRLSTVKNADKIVVIDKKHILQQGTHKELISQEGLYQRLYQMQTLESQIQDLE